MTVTHDEQWHEDASSLLKNTVSINNQDTMNKKNTEFKYLQANEQSFDEFWNGFVGNSKVVITEEKKIRRFPSGAVRSDDTGRIRPDYISPYAISEIALHFTEAKNDFGSTNYFLGIKPSDILPSVLRHILEFQEGVMNNDREMVRTALRSLGANAVMGLHQMVLEDKGEYKEKYETTELVNAEQYLKELESK